jgi:hypothetical protein
MEGLGLEPLIGVNLDGLKVDTLDKTTILIYMYIIGR